MLAQCLELKVRALLFTDEIRKALDNPTYRVEPLTINALEAKLSNPVTARFRLPHLQCNDEENKGMLLRLRAYLLIFQIKEKYQTDITYPPKQELEQLKDFSDVTYKKRALIRIFPLLGVVGKQRISEIEKDMKTYVRYWLEFYHCEYFFDTRVPYVNQDGKQVALLSTFHATNNHVLPCMHM